MPRIPPRTPDRTNAIKNLHGTHAFAPANEETPPPGSYPFLSEPVLAGELGRVGHYRVLRLLGEGGMGMVFAAEDVALARPVALKVMRPELADDPAGGLQRFLREARALAAVKHPNLVTVHQAFRDHGSVFLVMELLEGESLEEWVRRPEFPDPLDIIRIAAETAAGLAALHEHGLIHRDIKPANIWVEAPGGRVRILDLGLVQSLTGNTRLTEAGMVVGTPAYMSPEQARGRQLDPRTDLFSLGGVLFALCTGRTPFESDNPLALAAALAVDDPPPVRELNPAIPRPLADLVAQLLAKNPDDRPPSAAAVVERLRAMSNPVVVVAEPVPEPEPAPEPEPTPRRREKPKPPLLRRHLVKLVAALWLVVVALAVVAVARSSKEADPEPGEKPPEPVAKSPKAPAPKPTEPDFLTKFTPASAVGWPPPKMPPNFDGTIRVKGEASPNGIFMHPGPPDAPPVRVAYTLNKKHTRFQATLAMNDSAPPKAPPARFVVVRDGVEWWSGDVFPGTTVPCDLDVRGVQTLTIGVEVPGDPGGAHAVWVEPRLTK